MQEHRKHPFHRKTVKVMPMAGLNDDGHSTWETAMAWSRAGPLLTLSHCGFETITLMSYNFPAPFENGARLAVLDNRL